VCIDIRGARPVATVYADAVADDRGDSPDGPDGPDDPDDPDGPKTGGACSG
jgi:hypothetical protein